MSRGSGGGATWRSSSATPTTSCRTRSARGCRRSGRGPRSTMRSAATSPGWTRRRWRTGRACGRGAGAPPTGAGCGGAGGGVRRRGGSRAEEPVAVVTVGGSGVGEALLRRVLEAYPLARKEVDGLRLLVVAGPRIDASTLPAPEGVEVRGYVEDLHLHLAACDVAVVQGGLTTSMELVASRRPFVYVPLGDHFEQQRHVRHRLERHRAGRAVDYATAGPGRNPPAPGHHPAP